MQTTCFTVRFHPSADASRSPGNINLCVRWSEVSEVCIVSVCMCSLYSIGGSARSNTWFLSPAKVSEPAEKLCSDSVQPYLGSVLEELMEPISSGFQEGRQLSETLMDEVCQDALRGDNEQVKKVCQSYVPSFVFRRSCISGNLFVHYYYYYYCKTNNIIIIL